MLSHPYHEEEFEGQKKTARAVVRRLLPRRSNSIRTALANCSSGCLGWRLWISGSSRYFRRSFRIETFARRFLSRGHPTPSAAREGAANKNKLTRYPDVNRVSYSPVFTGYSQMWICSTAGRARSRSCILTFCRRPPANHWPLFPPSPFARH